MNRRDLLRMLLAAPIAATMDIEKMLWIPGQMVTVPAMPSNLYIQISCDISAFIESVDVLQREIVDMVLRGEYVKYRYLEPRFVELYGDKSE